MIVYHLDFFRLRNNADEAFLKVETLIESL